MSNQSSTFQPPYMHSYINKYAVKSIYERANLQRFCMHFCWIVWSKTEKWFYWPAFSKNKGGRIISINHKGKTIHNFVIRYINYNTCDILIVFETNQMGYRIDIHRSTKILRYGCFEFSILNFKQIIFATWVVLWIKVREKISECPCLLIDCSLHFRSLLKFRILIFVFPSGENHFLFLKCYWANIYYNGYRVTIS